MSKSSTAARGGKATSRNSAGGRGASKKSAASSRSGNGRSENNRSENSQRSGGASSSRGSNGSSGRSGSSGSGGSGNKQSSAQSTTRSSASTAASSRQPERRGARQASGQGGNEGYLQKFFSDQLKDIYYAEQKLIQALGTMKDAASTEELKEMFEDHLHQTERHVRRLERVFESIGMRPEGKQCQAIEGIIREVEEIIEETEEGSMTRDAALIFGAQKAEHYEIASYGGLVTFAITMGLYEAADLLDKTLIEEEMTDQLLTSIAEDHINLEAEFEGEGSGEEESGEEGEEEEASEEEGEEGSEDEQGADSGSRESGQEQ